MSCIARTHQTLSVKINRIDNWEHLCEGNEEKCMDTETWDVILELYEIEGTNGDERILTEFNDRMEVSKLLNQPRWEVTKSANLDTFTIQLNSEHTEILHEERACIRITILSHAFSSNGRYERDNNDEETCFRSYRRVGVFVLQLTDDVLSSANEILLSSNCGSAVSISLFLQAHGNQQHMTSGVSTRETKSNEVLVGETLSWFIFSVDIKYCKAMGQLLANKEDEFFWISCEYLGKVVQSDKMKPSLLFADDSMRESIFSVSFLFDSAYGTASNVFNKGGIGHTFDIFICVKDAILGYARTSIEWRDFQRCEASKKFILKGFVHMNPYMHGCNDTDKWATVCTSLRSSEAALAITLSFFLTNNHNDTTNALSMSLVENALMDPMIKSKNEPHRNKKAMKISNENEFYSLNVMKENWHKFRFDTEKKFQKSVREKENALRRYFEEQRSFNEKEKEQAIRTLHMDYRKLRNRLKTALTSIESKERELERNYREKENKITEKITALNLEQAKNREETKRQLDVEVSLTYPCECDPFYF